MVLLIDENDIQRVQIKPIEVIKVVEKCYKQDGLGKAQDTPRMEIRIRGKDLPHIAPGTTSIGMGMAYLEKSNLLVIAETFHFDFHKYITKILDPDTGETLAIVKREREPFGIESTKINTGNLRTGAAAAVGAKYLANENVLNIGIIGTGRIGKSSLICLAEVRNFENVYTHSGRRKDPSFTNFMRERLDSNIIPLETVRKVVEKSDVIITSTYAQEPLVKGSWLKPGVHISGMGADGPLKAELDPEVFRMAQRIYIDSPKCLEIGEVKNALSLGAITRKSITGRIGELIAGKKPGRKSNKDITIFESDGTHMQSASVAGLIYQKVKAAGLGTETTRIENFLYNP